MVRISEALAKMELRPFASPAHVEESLRLFHVRDNTSFIRSFNTGTLSYIIILSSHYPEVHSGLIVVASVADPGSGIGYRNMG